MFFCGTKKAANKILFNKWDKRTNKENTETQRLKIILDITSVVDRHRFNADPDPDPDWYQKNADPHT